MSFALTLCGTSNFLEATYSPAIELQGSYEIGLILLETFNSIPNITKNNNCFYYNNGEKIEIPEGAYELSDISKYIKKRLLEKNEEAKFILTGNRNTLQSEIFCSYDIDFSTDKLNNIGSVLGFNKFLQANTLHISTEKISIINVNSVQVISNISAGAYTNNQQSHSIFEFGIDVSPGFRISIAPSKVIYFPITVQTLSNLSFKLVDQNNNQVNFRNENIVIRVHLRKCR